MKLHHNALVYYNIYIYIIYIIIYIYIYNIYIYIYTQQKILRTRPIVKLLKRNAMQNKLNIKPIKLIILGQRYDISRGQYYLAGVWKKRITLIFHKKKLLFKLLSFLIK